MRCGISASGRFRIHFLNNADASIAQHLVARLDPARTAVVLVSKSFGTQETLLNGDILKAWLGDDERLFAVTANVDKAAGVRRAGRTHPADVGLGRRPLFVVVGGGFA